METGVTFVMVAMSHHPLAAPVADASSGQRRVIVVVGPARHRQALGSVGAASGHCRVTGCAPVVAIFLRVGASELSALSDSLPDCRCPAQGLSPLWASP